MLFDLHQGSMIVWKNDEKLGVMQSAELSGPFCWAVEILYHDRTRARIESAPLPNNTTEEELAATQDYLRRLRRVRLRLPLTATDDAECEAGEAAAAEAEAADDYTEACGRGRARTSTRVESAPAPASSRWTMNCTRSEVLRLFF